MIPGCLELGDVYYKKWTQYEMDWGDRRSSGKTLCVGAPLGGPIAILSGDNAKMLEIFSASGRKYGEWPWNSSHNIINMGWSDQEDLVCVMDDGSISLFNLRGSQVDTFSLFDSDEQGVLELVEIWGDGVAAVTQDGTLRVLSGIANSSGKLKRKAIELPPSLNNGLLPTTMAVLDTASTVEVFLASESCSVVVVDARSGQLQEHRLGRWVSEPVFKIAPSPNGRFIACWCRDSHMIVFSSTFTDQLLEYDTNSSTPPKHLAWCGDDCVVLHWKGLVIVVGPNGSWMDFNYGSEEDPLCVVAEVDCCRIVTPANAEILQKLHPVIVSVRSIGSTDPAALLFDATDAFQEGDVQADANIRAMEEDEQLVVAVQDCLRAALSEFDINKQQEFLRAASFGRAFCPSLDPEKFVKAAKKLRVLNSVRDPAIGIPLTSMQFSHISPQILINRLVKRNHHLLALKVSEYLNFKKDSVLIHWACEKVSSMAFVEDDDATIANTIRRQLEPYGKISFLPMARTAGAVGREHLATLLLNWEPSVNEQVPLLLEMRLFNLAMQKAVNSRDTNLIFLVLFQLAERIEGSEEEAARTYQLIYSYPEAAKLMQVYLTFLLDGRSNTRLVDFLKAGEQVREEAAAEISFAYSLENSEERPAQMVHVLEVYGRARELQGHQKLLEDQLYLMEQQAEIDFRFPLVGKAFKDLSLSATLYKLLVMSINAREDHGDARSTSSEDQQYTNTKVGEIVSRLKVSEKRLYHLRIRAFVDCGRWDLLRKLASDRRSPIGYVPFAKAAIRGGRDPGDVEFFVDRIDPPEDRFELYMQINSFEKAAQAAFKGKNERQLGEVYRRCQDPALRGRIDDMRANL